MFLEAVPRAVPRAVPKEPIASFPYTSRIYCATGTLLVNLRPAHISMQQLSSCPSLMDNSGATAGPGMDCSPSIRQRLVSLDVYTQDPIPYTLCTLTYTLTYTLIQRGLRRRDAELQAPGSAQGDGPFGGQPPFRSKLAGVHRESRAR